MWVLLSVVYRHIWLCLNEPITLYRVLSKVPTGENQHRKRGHDFIAWIKCMIALGSWLRQIIYMTHILKRLGTSLHCGILCIDWYLFRVYAGELIGEKIWQWRLQDYQHKCTILLFHQFIGLKGICYGIKKGQAVNCNVSITIHSGEFSIPTMSVQVSSWHTVYWPWLCFE